MEENQMHCPKCNSTQLTAVKQSFSGKKAFAGAVLTVGIGLLAGAPAASPANPPRPLHLASCNTSLSLLFDGAPGSIAIPDTQRLIICSLDGRSTRRIPVTGESNHVPMWSPDSKSLAFIVSENGHGVLAVVNKDGNTPRLFHNAISAWGQSFKWSPNSQSIGFLDPQRHQFQILDVATGSVRTIAVDSTAQVGNWMWRPDGRSIVAVKTTPGLKPGLRFLKRRVDEVTLSGKQRVLLDTVVLHGAPGITFFNAYTIFVRYDSAAYLIPLDGSTAQQVIGGLSGKVRPTTGVHATAPSTEMWAGLINRDGLDSGQIEFISARTGQRHIVDVPFSFPSTSSPEWTPDGRELIVVGQPRGEAPLTLYRVPIDGAEPSVITMIGPGSDGWTNVSPDGKLVVYGIYRSNNAMKRDSATRKGLTVEDFQMETIDGKMFSSKNLSSKYTLLDFWAHDCYPCRKQHPALVKLYEDYHEKGFEIVAIGVETSKQEWQKAVQQDNLPWIHVSDLKDWDNFLVKRYFVDEIPFNILIDENKKIVATHLSPSALKEKLQQLLGH